MNEEVVKPKFIIPKYDENEKGCCTAKIAGLIKVWGKRWIYHFNDVEQPKDWNESAEIKGEDWDGIE